MVRRLSLGARIAAIGALPGLALALLLGALLFAGAYQIPARHEVAIGGYDAAYAQGFFEPERAADFRAAPEPHAPPPYLEGSNGAARWTRASSALRFPQSGQPAAIALRVRGWRAEAPFPRLQVLLNGQQLLADVPTTGAWQDVRVPIVGGPLKVSDFFIELRADTARLDDGRDVGVLLDAATYSVVGFPIAPDPVQLAYGALAAGLLWLLYRTADDRRQTADRSNTDGRRQTADRSNTDGRRQTADRSNTDGRRQTADRSNTDGRPQTADRSSTTMSNESGGRRSVVGGRERSEHGGQRSAVSGRRSAVGVYAVAFLALLLLFIFCYRLQPPVVRFPLLWLMPVADGLLAAALALRVWRRPCVRSWLDARPWLADAAAGLVVALWLGAVLLYAQGHVTEAVPGVEKDFRVFATRPDFASIFRADGFYNLGYPLLLWLARPLTSGNAFLAGRLLSALFGALLLGAGYWLARAVLPSRPAALLALVALACSPFVAQYGLLVGSDMPFAALITLSLALFAAGRRGEERNGLLFAAGLAGGGAFLVRHLGLVVVVWGALWLRGGARNDERGTMRKRSPFIVPRLSFIVFAVGFLLAAAPQLAVNVAQTGNPLYNQQAKNVWLGVYANTDFDRWNEAPNDIGLADVVLRDPPRFLANWASNLRAFFGTGAEDTSEFGRAIQLRLLGWPANWLALLYFGFLILDFGLGGRNPKSKIRNLKLASFALLYVLAVCAAFALPRFFLPLAPLYALGVGGMGLLAFRRWPESLWPPVAALALVAVLLPGVGIGANAVLAAQPADEVAAVALVERTLAPGEVLLAQLPADVPLAKYSAIAHRAAAWPAPSPCGSPVSPEALAAARSSSNARYLLWADACGAVPLPPADLRGRAGPFALYALR